MQLLTRHVWLIPALFALVVSLVGWNAYRSLEASTKRELAEELKTLLAADVTALHIWVHTQKSVARRAAEDPTVRRLVSTLVAKTRAGGDPAEGLRKAPEQAEVNALLAGVVEAHGYVGFAVIDPYGVWIATVPATEIGKRLAPLDAIAAAHRGEVAISPPLLVEAAVSPDLVDDPVLILAAPIRNAENQVIAALTFALDARKQFSEILHAARMGESGETYAFDRNGRMLSESRFNEQIAELGLIPSPTRSALLVQIRDPGADLTRGGTSDLPLAARPLTRMAADAISGNEGHDVDGYRDYRGVPVVGAWTWIDELDLGVATEIDVAEAYAGVASIRNAFGAVGALLLVATLGLLLYSTVVVRMRSQVDRAQKLGRYRIEDKIGEGGMGKVYRARHALLRRPTAIKLLSAEHAKSDGAKRFEREVQATADLTHPNTIAIFDYGHTPEGVFYYAMEYLDGVNLSKLVSEDGPQPDERVASVMKQVCGSIAEAHDHGLIHRDLKPQNIMLCERGGMPDFAKVLDFGLVRDANSELSLTNIGALTGTPLYLSPEALESPETLDSRSDLYQIGAVMYFMLTGRPVFSGETLVEVLGQHLHSAPELPSNVSMRPISKDLEGIVLRCLAKKPDDRFQTARDVLRALAKCTFASPWSSDDAEEWWKQWRISRPAFESGEESSSSAPSGYEVDLAGRTSRSRN